MIQLRKRGVLRVFAVAIAAVMVATATGRGRLQAMMIPQEKAAQAYDRAADLASIQSTLENKLVRQRLADYGLNEQQINQRLNHLSDQQLHQVAMKIDQQRPAGDSLAITILIAVAVVALIIYLVDRL